MVACARSCARCRSKVRHVKETKVGGSGFCLSENRHGAGLLKRRRGPDKREVGSSTLPRPICRTLFPSELRARWDFFCVARLCPFVVPVGSESAARSAARRANAADPEQEYLCSAADGFCKLFSRASVVSQLESLDWEVDLWLFVPSTMRRTGSVQPHLSVTSAHAVLKNAGERFTAWQNLSTD
jgi:hypothetical protein